MASCGGTFRSGPGGSAGLSARERHLVRTADVLQVLERPPASGFWAERGRTAQSEIKRGQVGRRPLAIQETHRK